MKLVAFLFALGCLLLFSILYVFASFTYTVSDGQLILRWKILKYVPFNSYRIDFDDIEEARMYRFPEDFISLDDIWGTLIRNRNNRVILLTKRRLTKKIYVTPENPNEFIKLINDRTDL